MTQTTDGGRCRRRPRARSAASLGLVALFAIGACRQIFGLEEAVSYTSDTAVADAGETSAPVEQVTQTAALQPQPLLDAAADAGDAGQ